MSSATTVSVEDYLRMTFDGPDREYVDGEILEREMGDEDHSAVQGRLVEIFYEIRKTKPLRAFPELRHRVRAQSYRVPDIAVRAGRGKTSVPSEPPIVAIEVLSSDDRMSRVVERLEEYAGWGAPHIWVVDPKTQKLFRYTREGLLTADAFELPEYGVRITPEQIFRED